MNKGPPDGLSEALSLRHPSGLGSMGNGTPSSERRSPRAWMITIMDHNEYSSQSSSSARTASL
jgi:hypothetical protein